MTLNLAATTKLAWQQRKAESFDVTPQFCRFASDELGYRSTKEYGNPRDDGISVGTAMAISGAAVSPNMGYHSSPSIAVLLTLLNVRLGWWLGNPGHRGGQDGRLSAFCERDDNGGSPKRAPARKRTGGWNLRSRATDSNVGQPEPGSARSLSSGRTVAFFASVVC
jgi:hypothetical protein